MTQPPDNLSGPVLSVIVPVFNEKHTLAEAFARILASPVDKEILFVDDCSTDGTRELLEREVEGRFPNVQVIYQSANGGKGTAIRAAIPHLRGQFVIIQDADLEYDPADFPAMLEPALNHGAEVVYGTRFQQGLPSQMRLPNKLVNWLLAAMVRLLYRSPMTDEATCYKLFRTELLQSMPLTCRRFEFCPEVTAKVLRSGKKIVEVPVRYAPRTMAEGKKIRWTDGVDAIWTLLKHVRWRPNG